MLQTLRAWLAPGQTTAIPQTLGLFVGLLLLRQASFVGADNPIIQTIYTADPAPLVYNNRVYVFVDHDNGNVGTGGGSTFDMTDWHLFSSADMVNWQDHGVTMSLSTFSWANGNAWAGQVWPRNGNFYYYAPMRHSDGQMAIGVGVSANITGPYKDALGKPLVENNEFDPTVWIDTDGQAYMYWGNPDLYYVKLNSDMLSYSGSPVKVSLTTGGFGTRQGSENRPTSFEEAPWLYERNGIYYMAYAADCCSEDIRYSTGTSVTGPWTYKGVIMETQGSSFTNHEGIIDFMGNSYFFYHNGALPGGGGYDRSVCVEQFTYNSDGTIPSIKMTTTGAAQVGTLNPYVRQEAETIAWSVGVNTETCNEGGMDVCNINSGDYIKVKGVNFGTGATSFSARVASANSGGTIALHLGSTTGTLIGTCTVPGTGGWQTWQTVTCTVSGASGTQDLFLVFGGSGSGYLFNFNWWQFAGNSGSSSSSSSSVAPPSTSTSAPPPASSSTNPMTSSSKSITTTPTTTKTTTTTTTTTSSSGSCQTLYGQCGGIGWSGPTCCSQGTCNVSNPYYSQCLNS